MLRISYRNKGKNTKKGVVFSLDTTPSFSEICCLQIAALLVKVVLVSSYGQLVARCFVADHDSMRVHLEHGRSPLVADVAVNAVLEGTCLVVTATYEKHLLGVHHCANADGQSLLRHEAEVIVEEAAVGVDGVGGESLDTGA